MSTSDPTKANDKGPDMGNPTDGAGTQQTYTYDLDGSQFTVTADSEILQQIDDAFQQSLPNAKVIDQGEGSASSQEGGSMQSPDDMGQMPESAATGLGLRNKVGRSA
jgi:hypothetical protein